VLYPQTYSGVQGGGEACGMHTECLICGNPATVLEVKLRFLHLRVRSTLQSPRTSADSLPNGWQEAVERDVSLPASTLHQLISERLNYTFTFPPETQVDPEHDSDGRAVGSVVRRQAEVRGTVDVTIENVRPDLFKASVFVRNTTPMEVPEAGRDEALMQSLVSTHIVLNVDGGEFVSLLEPPAELQEFAAKCQNVGTWPVLVGEVGQRDTLLASPIILYDYPQIAPESAGDLFDGTEIDEILSLRIMTLTDEEKREIRHSDDRARQILERTETMPAEQFMKLHGAVRSLRPLKENNP